MNGSILVAFVIYLFLCEAFGGNGGRRRKNGNDSGCNDNGGCDGGKQKNHNNNDNGNFKGNCNGNGNCGWNVDGNGDGDCDVESGKKCCPCFPSEEAQAALDNLFIQLPPAANCKEYCRIAKKDLRTFSDYASDCRDNANVSEAMMQVSEGFDAYLKKSCTGRCNFRTHCFKVVHFKATSPQDPKCDKAVDAYNAAKGCLERLVNAAYYILKNIPPKDQLQLYCCFFSNLFDCISKEVTDICDEKYAKFFVNRTVSPISNLTFLKCDKQVCDQYPTQMAEMLDILENSQTLNRSITFAFYQILFNTVEAQCYTYE